MESSHDELVDVLNDLVKINNDRVAGYERAIKETKDLDVDLKAMFEGLIRETYGYKEELVEAVGRLGGDVAKDTTIQGKIYRAWMDVKATFTGSDRKAILENCVFGEEAWRRAYEAALSSDTEIDAEYRQIISRHFTAEQAAYDMLKKYHDAHVAVG